MGAVFALIFLVLCAATVGFFIGGIFSVIRGVRVLKGKEVKVRAATPYLWEIVLILIGICLIPFFVGIWLIVIAIASIKRTRKRRKNSPQKQQPQKKIIPKKSGVVMCIAGCVMIIAPVALRIGIIDFSTDYQKGYVDTGIMCKKVDSSRSEVDDAHFIDSFTYKGEKYVFSEELSVFKTLIDLNIFVESDNQYSFNLEEVVANIKYRDYFLYFLVGAQDYLNVYKVENETGYNMLFVRRYFRGTSRVYVPEKHKQEIESYYIQDVLS
jgi:hypothetical protein